MKILKLLNKKNLIIISFFIISVSSSLSEEPVDIWDIESKDLNSSIENDIESKNESAETGNSIYDMQLQKNDNFRINEEVSLLSKKIEISGLYDPEQNGLKIDMWSNSDGKDIINLFNRIKKIQLSDDAKEIMDISILTNSYYPSKNISNEEFVALKIDWMISNGNLDLMKEYIFKNKSVNENLELIKFLVDEYLSKSELKNACDIFLDIDEPINDEYLSRFNIYCLVNEGKIEEALLQFDLKKELGFDNKFFEQKFFYLVGYENKIEKTISEKSILDFHLSHRTNPDFKFEPNSETNRNIWRYLKTSNLLENIEDIDLKDQTKISSIEKATHEKNYNEKDLFELYKRFQFNINQLLNVKEAYKLLSGSESKALIYQGILITNEIEKKLELVKILKELFIVDEISNAFQDHLLEILQEINLDEVPSNYTRFFDTYLNEQEVVLTKIKINNKIIHRSKLLNYFRTDISKKNIEKDLNDILKKIKKDKKYFISTKDIILLESLKADGIETKKKYSNLYKIEESNMPEDIQNLINKKEMGLVLLRLAQVIGQDDLKNIEPETLFFIISALNQLNIDSLRNKILIKVLPLKV